VVFQTGGESRKLALTFDDGPDPRWTPLVLDMLARLHVRATFFVLGSAVEAHPELIAREVAEGHEVAVHNWVHTDVYGVGFSELSDSVDRTREAIMAAGAPSPRLWRPPYGRVDAPAMMVASLKRMDLLLWSEHTPSAEHARALTTRVHAGSIILCHDGRTQPSRELLRGVGGRHYYVGAENVDGTGGGVKPGGQDFTEGGFAGTVHAENGRGLPRRNSEGDISECGEFFPSGAKGAVEVARIHRRRSWGGVTDFSDFRLSHASTRFPHICGLSLIIAPQHRVSTDLYHIDSGNL